MKNSEVNSGKKWPWIIGLSIVGIIVACVVTIKVAISHPVEMSDYGMQSYHDYDTNVNEIIEAKIAFNKLYKIEYTTNRIELKQTIIAYRVSDINGKPVNNATIEVVLTRPDTRDFDITLTKPVVLDGVYISSPTNLPKVGRWDILAKISVGDKQRFYNLKADTRYSQTEEF